MNGRVLFNGSTSIIYDIYTPGCDGGGMHPKNDDVMIIDDVLSERGSINYYSPPSSTFYGVIVSQVCTNKCVLASLCFILRPSSDVFLRGGRCTRDTRHEPT